ncbi:helix-turn-helix domain-containing protein [Maribellus comscasis]|uniref:Helix-turn-helix domain-containing protein n=1 Tax=Maribellus comscasis TaxID=2681766 RepID=A0A6I6JLN8_9BACT|nr:AraC family transcriptional regulator [Maribellus comscasis]QGY43775.1 helix-turn-helix domain-containing protein [Maribellus comscasis]
MNVKTKTRDYYFERINKVIHHINNHLDETLDVSKLAEIGNYSPYHFHRIMKAYLGEPLGAYIQRLRLETAISLLLYSNEPVNNIAYNVGYETPSSFNKAFKKRYGISPVEYRKNNELTLKSEHSKIKFNAMENLKSLQPKIKTVKPKTVVYARAIGNYNLSAEKAWKTVCEFAKTKKLFGFKTEFIGISHDDPKITEAEKLRYDACVAISKNIAPEGEIGVQEIPGGEYAVFTHKGPYEKLENTYAYIFGKWLSESGKELRNVHSFEKYLNAPENTKPEKLRTEIYIPVQ